MLRQFGYAAHLAVCVALMGAGCTSNTAPSPITGYKLETRIIAIHEDGSEEPTGFVAMSEGWPTMDANPTLVASENQKRVAYAVWEQERYGMVIYVSDLDGSNKKIVARQSVPEGNGELDTDSLIWTNNSTIRYSETGSRGEDGMISRDEKLTWEVNVDTGEKLRIPE